MSIEAEITEIDRPVSDEHPCGEDLEDTQLLASFDAYRLFGQAVPLSAETDWRDIKANSLEALKKSKDFRLLAHFAAAALRVDGWVGFLSAIHVAAGWIKVYWKEVYPPVDDDAILRKNALNSFSDRMSILDGVRRLPIVENRQLGRISLRDVDLATGQLAPTEADTAPATEAQVAAVFAAAPLEELQASKTLFDNGIADLKSIDTAMRDFGGAAASPDFDPLIALLVKIDKLVGDELTARGATEAESSGDGQPAESAGGQAIGTGSIKSRQDAIRALDAISTFFRQSEPSSPIPLFLDRAKKLIGKDFLEILADVAPEGVATARSAGGLTD
jgi:type VI secretion system protein ImpA